MDCYAEGISAGGLGTIVTPIDNGTQFLITGGSVRAARGSVTNLFHNFNSFSIKKDNSAVFLNDHNLGETNIIALVKNNSPSFIDGLIKTEGYDQGVSLFLLNPSGIFFEKNAKLDINGSLHVSTANKLGFGEDIDLLVNSLDGSMLTAAPLNSFGFLGAPSDIQINSSSLNVDEGKTFSLIGGNVKIDNGKIKAPYGRINLVSMGADGTVDFNYETNAINIKTINLLFGNTVLRDTELNISALKRSDFSQKINKVGISLFSKDLIVSGGNMFANNINTGGIQLISEVMDIGGGVSISTTTNKKYIEGGDIQIFATKSLVISGKKETILGNKYVSISTTTAGNGGDSGNIQIKSPKIHLNDSATITASGSGVTGAKSGTIEINADYLTISNRANISTSASGNGQSGSIILDISDHLALSNRASIKANVSGSGNSSSGGNINIGSGLLKGNEQNEFQFKQPTKFVTLTGSSSIQGKATQGQGGRISIKTKHLLRSTDSIISTQSSGNIDGTIEVTSPISNVVPGTVQLPQSYLTAIEISGNPCAARTSSNGNSLIVRESSGIAPEPDSMLSANGSIQSDQLPPINLQAINNTFVLSELECKAENRQ